MEIHAAIRRVKNLIKHSDTEPTQVLSAPIHRTFGLQLRLWDEQNAQGWLGGRNKRGVLRRVKGNLRPEQILTALEWLRSGLGLKITRLEKAASTPKALKEMETFSMQLNKV